MTPASCEASHFSSMWAKYRECEASLVTNDRETWQGRSWREPSAGKASCIVAGEVSNNRDEALGIFTRASHSPYLTCIDEKLPVGCERMQISPRLNYKYTRGSCRISQVVQIPKPIDRLMIDVLVTSSVQSIQSRSAA